jgi:hypothetical protein
MNDLSTNGDGKKRPPTNRIPSCTDGQKPATASNPKDEREQQIIKALKGRYDEIEALWTKAEEDLKRFRIPHRVEHCYDSNYDCGGYPEHRALWWARYGKGWRIVHEVRIAYSEIDDGRPDESCEWKPITECPLDVRLSMISEFENLRRKVIEAAEKAVPTLDEAISSFHKILNG